MTFRLRLQRKLLAEKYFDEKKVFPINFRLSAHDAWVSGKKPEGSSKVNSTCPEEIFGKKLFLRKKIIIFGNAAEIAGTFNWIFCHGCQIFLPRVQKKKHLREQKLEKKEYSILFSSLKEKVSKFCKSFQQSLQNCVLPIQAINSRKFYSWNVTYLRGF